MADRESRAVAALVGAVVADAAAVPCHWQYDVNSLSAALGDSDPAFFEGSWPNPFYRLPLGSNSCYGDQLRTVIGCLADKADLASRFEARFRADDYERTAAERKYAGDQRAVSQVQGPWRHGTIERFLASKVDNVDTSIDAVIRAIPAAVVAALDGGDVVDDVVTVTQLNPVARAYARDMAAALADVIRNGTRPDVAVAAVPSTRATDLAELRHRFGFDDTPHKLIN